MENLFKDIEAPKETVAATTTPVKQSEKAPEATKPVVAPVLQAGPVKASAPPQAPEDDLVIEDPLELAKGRAMMMGIALVSEDTLETIKQKIENKMNPPKPVEEPKEVAAPMDLNGQANIEVETNTGPELTPRQIAWNNATKLIRVRIQNLNPRKADLSGEIFTIANDQIGTISKYIPYGEGSEGGYHIPYCLYENLLERTFQNLQVKINKKSNRPEVNRGDVREFAIEVLPPLTEAELQQLATAQIAAGSVEA